MSSPADVAAGRRPVPLVAPAVPSPAQDGQDPGPARLHRQRTGRVVAGVAGGVAEHLGLPVLWVRVVFAVLTGFGGAGVVAYALLWAFVPSVTTSTPARPGTAREQQQAIGLLALGGGIALAAGALGGTWSTWITGPLGVALVGAAVVWREADSGQRRRWWGGAGRVGLLRVLAGAGLVAAGITVFLLNQGDLGQLQFALLAATATLVGVVVLTVPWWLRLAGALTEERRARIRTEERAEIAAHLHDSVLQTLALIQQQSESAREVRRLARGQERELRAWLYGAAGYGATDGGADGVDGGRGSFAEALSTAAGEVEDTYAVSVQVVAVGDRPLDDAVAPLVLASREAMVNAAKHAGVAEFSVYAEVEPAQVTVFVRDRGAGFDPDRVRVDRHGLADSVRGRMARLGGTVKVRTAPGEGTEVQLAVPLRDQEEDR